MNRSLQKSPDQVAVGGTVPWKSILLFIVLATGGLAFGAVAQEDPGSGPVVEATFGSGLDRESRLLVGPAVEFGPDVEQVYCLTRIRGLESPTTVTHAWYHEGQAKARVELKIGSSDWRTWSSKRILPAWTGSWEVKVLDATGKVLATFGFAVE